MEYKRAWANIYLANLAHNLRAVRAHVPPATKLLTAVKADAYGHGIIESAKVFLANGSDFLGVALCEEGLALRQSGITAPILVMSYTPEQLAETVVATDLVQTCFCAEIADWLAKAAHRQNKQAQVHIKIDTGMGRLGFLPTPESAAAICEILSNPVLNVTGIYTHFAKSDENNPAFMYEQLARFEAFICMLRQRGVPVEKFMLHMGNSGMLAHSLTDDSAEKYSGARKMFMDMVRIGIMLYGLPPSAEMAWAAKKLNLRPAMQFMTRVSMTKKLPAGSGVSYGHMFTAKRETLVATLPVGYADGYPRLLSGKGKVLIRGQVVPIIGAICMDQMMVDVTDVPTAASIVPGEEAILFGPSGPAETDAETLAAQIGTIGYEILCGVGKRVPRIYVGNLPKTH